MPDTRDIVKRQFGAHAENYVSSSDHAQGKSLDRLLALAAPQPGWRALDIATGGGHMALALAAHVREVVATNLTVEMLAAAERFVRARGAGNVVFREADAQALPFGEAEFDLITCRIAAHHFPDCAQFVREAARVLRPGGRLAVIDNVAPEDASAARHLNAIEKLRDPSHNWAYSAADWLGFYSAAGLTVSHSEIFRKSRDLDAWCARLDVAPLIRAQLRALFLQAPRAAREALAPTEIGARLEFILTELLIIGLCP